MNILTSLRLSVVKVGMAWTPRGGYFKPSTDATKYDDDDRKKNTITESGFRNTLVARYFTEQTKKAEGMQLAPTPQTGVFQPEFREK